MFPFKRFVYTNIVVLYLCIQMHTKKNKNKKRLKSKFKSICVLGIILSCLGFSRNRAAPMKGDTLSCIYELLIPSKQKHNDGNVKLFIHYNKHSDSYYIPFLRVHNPKSGPLTLAIMKLWCKTVMFVWDHNEYFNHIYLGIYTYIHIHI